MKALQIVRPGELKLVDLDTPVPDRSQVLIRVKRGGICGSDMHIFHGSNPFASYPRIPGHEFVGEVVGLGDDVEGFSLGNHVAVNPVVSCGSCHPCRNGQPNVCTTLEVFGVHRDGGFAQLIAVDAASLHLIPDSISWDDAVFIEPFSIAANVTSRIGLQGKDSLLVIGAGTIGLTILQVAKIFGARVAVCDMLDGKLEQASKMGADAIINTSRESIETRALEFTGGDGPSAIIDAAGVPALMGTLARIACPGGRIGILGFSTSVSEITQYEITRKELVIAGSRLNNGKFPQVIAWMVRGKIRPVELFSRMFPIRDAPEAFRYVESNRETVLKVLLDIEAV